MSSVAADLDAQVRAIYVQLECVLSPARTRGRPPAEGFALFPHVATSRVGCARPSSPLPPRLATDRASHPLPSRSNGFGDTATLEGDPAAASAHLKAMTSKMAESKRLIKEYERVSKETEGADLDAVAARKKEMVQKLNTYVNKKKAAQADIAARVASTAAAVGVPARRRRRRRRARRAPRRASRRAWGRICRARRRMTLRRRRCSKARRAR